MALPVFVSRIEVDLWCCATNGKTCLEGWYQCIDLNSHGNSVGNGHDECGTDTPLGSWGETIGSPAPRVNRSTFSRASFG